MTDLLGPAEAGHHDDRIPTVRSDAFTTTAPAARPVPLRSAVGGWTLHLREPVDQVPDHVHQALEGGLDVGEPVTALAALVRAGLVGDVTVDATEEEVAWVGATGWEYRTQVERPTGADHAELVLEGIDTVGRVLVDGEVLLEVANMFRRHVVDLTPVLEHSGEVLDVRVQLDPALPVAAAAEARNPLPRADVYELPYNQVRKMACSFGWDWGPVTQTAGLWRPVVLHAWSGARLEQVRVRGGWNEGAVLGLTVRASGEADHVRIDVRPVHGSEVRDDLDDGPVCVLPLRDGAASADLSLPRVRRWQPVGLGEQPLYDVVLELCDEQGRVLDTAVRRTGFRSVRVRQEPDAAGSSFELLVDGQRVWVRGFNWIPPHVLPETVTRAQVRHLVTEAVAAGANLLRVWGGGVLESEDFYDVCDELGVMVWQDFPFACAAYPEDPGTAHEVGLEVVDAVDRLGHRASLVMWCGCNENLWGFEDWGWKESLDGRAWGSGYYHDLIPRLLAEHDGTRSYVPGSPFSPGDVHPNDPGTGTTHHWDTWNQLDLVAFEEKTSRFAAEFGWQAPAGWPVLVRAIGSEPTGADDPRTVRLQKAFEGMASLARGVADHLPDAPTDGRGWYLATRLVQARAIRSSIGRFRSLHDTCSGAIWWQLDDCWPAMSWSVLDVAGGRKLGWYAMREVLSARTVLPSSPVAGAVTAVNDLAEAWEVDATIRHVGPDGAVLTEGRRRYVVPPRGHLTIGADEGGVSGAAAVVVDVDGRRTCRWLQPDLDLENRSAQVEIDVTPSEAGGVAIRVVAHHLVRDLVLLAETDDRLPDARVDDQLLTLLPGESATFTVTAGAASTLSSTDWSHLLAASGPLQVTTRPTS